MSNWLEKIVPSLARNAQNRRSSVPEGLWKKCPKCEAVLYRPELDKNLNVCPKCNHHMRVGARAAGRPASLHELGKAYPD